MQITVKTHGSVVAIEPAGALDTRGSVHLERALLEHLGKGSQQFIVDFARVDLVSGASIRVLMMLAQRVQASEGGLVLCSLNQDVLRVFEVSGLMSQFSTVSSLDEALAQLSMPVGKTLAMRRVRSKLTRLVGHLLEDGADDRGGRRQQRAASSPSELTRRVATLLATDPSNPLKP
jgi:anti-anti-sigma factor